MSARPGQTHRSNPAGSRVHGIPLMVSPAPGEPARDARRGGISTPGRVATAWLEELGGQMRYDRFAKDFGERLSEADARHQPAPRVRKARIAGAAAMLAAGAVVVGTLHSTTNVLKTATTATG